MVAMNFRTEKCFVVLGLDQCSVVVPQPQQNFYRASSQNSFSWFLSRKFSLHNYVISARECAKLGWKQSEKVTEGRIRDSYVNTNESKQHFNLLHSLPKKKGNKNRGEKKSTPPSLNQKILCNSNYFEHHFSFPFFSFVPWNNLMKLRGLLQ